MPTFDTPAARSAEFDRLLRFAHRSAVAPDKPFGYLDDRGVVNTREGYHLWVTCRMTHVFGLAALLGDDDAHELAGQGVAALRDTFWDHAHGGWFGRLDHDLRVGDERKSMYDHAFVLLAAGTAARAAVDGADELRRRVERVIEQYFWDEEAGACRESWDRAWQETESYRGANSNMHTVEAFLATGDVSGEPVWHHRALRICERIVHREAARHDWRLPEHFTAAWEVREDYNRDSPGDQFRPYGVTVGHLLEWARLLVHLEAALDSPPSWLLADAIALFDTAVETGWEADGYPGLVYTVDWRDRPVVTERMHWVAIEAALTANVLQRRLADRDHAKWEARLWEAVTPFVDLEHGSWHHELDASGQVSTTVWEGKPDVYHAAQGMLLPDLPITPSLAGAVTTSRRG